MWIQFFTIDVYITEKWNIIWIITLKFYEKNFFDNFFLIFSSNTISSAQVKNEKEAVKFLNFYCLELVKSIESSYYEQVEAAKLNNWETFMKKGRWIMGVAEVYSNLCK